MAQKFLMIGIGGSGGKTLRYTWRELDRRLTAAKWPESVPAGWQFLHIDVPQNVDVITGDVPADIGKDAKYLGLARQPDRYQDYDERLVENQSLLPALVGWRPNPARDYSSIYRGAGQRRAVGRVVTLTKMSLIGAAIKDAVATLATNDVTEQMERLARHLGSKKDQQDSDPATAVVVASLGGGSGSGAFLDVIELLRARATEGAQWLDNSLTTVLYAADVFSDLPADARTGIEPNTLAALCELLNASDHEDAVPDGEGRLLALGGGTAPMRGRRTGRHSFIIGSKNRTITFGNSLDVFRATGKALATLVADDRVRNPFNTYLETNADGRPLTDTFTLAAAGRCSSFGYANVSLGHTLFAEYAAERLAKRSIERLLRGHLEVEGDERLRNPQTLIDNRVATLATEFYDACGLWELNEDAEHDQVLDAMRDKAEVAEELNETMAFVQRKLSKLSKRSPKEWFESLTAGFDAQAVEFERWAHGRKGERAQQWVGDVQTTVKAATASYAGMYGLPVTLALVEAVGRQVLDAATELERDAAKMRAAESGQISGLRNLFLSVHDKVLGTTHESLSSALKLRRNALQQRFEADVCEFTAQVLRELESGLLTPLHSAVAGAHSDLAAAEAGDERELVQQWSTAATPPHLRPAPNELLLDKAAEFPKELERRLSSLFDDAGGKAGEDSAVVEIITGSWPSITSGATTPAEQNLIIADPSWSPTRSAARATSAAARSAAFSLQLTASVLKASAENWTTERQGPVSDYVRLTLAEWLKDDAENAAERASHFADVLGQALACAAPLISVNPAAHHLVHGDDSSPAMSIVSDIPIDDKHRAHDRIVESLTTAGVPADRIASLFNPGSPSSSVEISCFLSRYVHPVVFDSLTAPIQRDWQSRISDKARQEFWDFRRARPLRAFIPVSKSRQLALVRGWLTAALLGHVGSLEGTWADNPLSIWTPRGPRRFPSHLLRQQVTQQRDVLPALLESLPLALLTFGSGQPTELEAYLRLMELGTPANGLHASEPDANGELGQWVNAGKLTDPDPGFDGAPIPPKEYADTAASTAEERAAALVEALTQVNAQYSAEADQRITRETTLTVGPVWEIYDLVANASASLISEITAVPGEVAAPSVGALAVGK
jgi:hypothetical protein